MELVDIPTSFKHIQPPQKVVDQRPVTALFLAPSNVVKSFNVKRSCAKSVVANNKNERTSSEKQCTPRQNEPTFTHASQNNMHTCVRVCVCACV